MIGKTFHTKRDTIITVLKSVGKDKYEVHCSSCSEDKELFPNPLVNNIDQLNKNNFQCCCGHHYRWSIDQYLIRIKRKASERNYTFHGFYGDFIGKETKLSLECNNCNHKWNTTGINKFLNFDNGCPKCPGNLKKTDEEWLEIFQNLPQIKKGTEFVKENNQWFLICPKCSYDEYVEAGLCSGKFKITRNTTYDDHHMVCRCAKNSAYTKPQREFQIKQEMVKRNRGETFLCWETDSWGIKDNFYYNCKDHGKKSITVTSYIHSDCGCSDCSHKLPQTQIYIHKILEENKLKVGKAGDSKERLKVINRNSIFSFENIGVWEFKNSSTCSEVETSIKDIFDRSLVDKNLMKDGFTETYHLNSLPYIIDILVDNGGVFKPNLCGKIT